MRRFVLVSLVLTACASKPALPPPPPSAVVMPAPTSLRQAFPKEKLKQSSALLEILKASKVKAMKSNGHSVYRAYDVSCTSGGEKDKCTYAVTADCAKSSCRKPLMKTEELSGVLFELPIAQGDSGAESRFIECVEYGRTEASCTVAIELDYEGP